MSNKDQHKPGHPTVGHVSSIPQLFAVFGALVAMTILTVALSGKLPGAGGMLVAMGIATVKALLVALYFMHLRYDRPFHGYVFLASIMFVFCFFGITSLDSAAYRKDIMPYEEAQLGITGGVEEMYAEPRSEYQKKAHPDGASLPTSEEAGDENTSSPADPAAEPEAAGH